MEKSKLDEKFMRMAIDQAKKGLRKGQTPFGACIVKKGQVISCEHNTVWSSTDITAHAEVHAIRKACKKTGSIDLSGCIIYSTCEPCPMCFAAIHWAKIDTIVYGAKIIDAQRAGFHELTISNKRMKTIGASGVVIVDNFLREECRDLFGQWLGKKDRRVY